MLTSTDALLRRIEITAVVICIVFALLALVVADGRARAAAAVLAGGALVAVSYYTIKSAADVIVAAISGGEAARTRRRFVWTVAKIALRYALLAFLAYVMISRLRLHPLGLLAGASSVVAAVSVEALRLLVKKQS